MGRHLPEYQGKKRKETAKKLSIKNKRKRQEKKTAKKLSKRKRKEGNKEAIHGSKLKKSGIKERSRIQPWTGG